jgi:diaminopimelate epimerase
VVVVVTKHDGWGNDFLVLDVGQTAPGAGEGGRRRAADAAIDWPTEARRLCDRATGIGADGLLLMERRGEYEVAMRLYNADGSAAEMSGNGIRCLAQAHYEAEGHEGAVSYTVHTTAGPRRVDVERAPHDRDEVVARVDMGRVERIDAPVGWDAVGADPMRPVAHLSVGNPHAVVGVEDVRVVDLAAIGAKVPHVNLEIVEPGPEPDAVTMRVHERGAGLTRACGTGAVASAWAAREWGMVPSSARAVTVHQPGGDAVVRFATGSGGGAGAGSGGPVTLEGPARFDSRHHVTLGAS